jgi:hypothetical protein
MEDQMDTFKTAAILTAAMAFGLAAAPAVLGAEGIPAALPTPTRRVVVSIPDRMLALIENERVVATYPVAVGAPTSPSPIGTFTIVSRVSNPTFYKPGAVIAPGARNPIGTRWIGLNEKGYGVRGGDVVELHADRTPEIAQLFPHSK